MVDRSGPRRRYRGHSSHSGWPRHSVRDEPVWRLLRQAFDERAEAMGRPSLDVLDAGGGTGSFAVPIAGLGHRVTVIDPSPDSLAALERRAAEEDVTDRVRGVQAEATELPRVVADESFDVVVCHNVLEVVEDPAEALAAICRSVRPSGRLSILAANRNAVILGKVVAGHLEDAGRLMRGGAHDQGSAQDHWGAGDPLPRLFTLDQLQRLAVEAGLVVEASHGLHAFRDLAPAVSEDLGSDTILTELEEWAEEHPTFQAIASQLHVLARWGSLS